MMHAHKRRMPAERVGHAKRLGHVQQGSGPAVPVLAHLVNAAATSTQPTTTTSTQKDTTTAPTQVTLSTTTSAAQSSSAAAPTPSTSTSTSSTSTSSTTPLTSSVASSTSGQSIATTPISSLTPQSSTIPTLATSTTPTSLATTTPSTNVAATKSNGLSGGAIAGIIAGAIVVGVVLIMFFVRKTALRRRERNRISWSGAPGVTEGVFPEPKLPELSERPASAAASVPLSPFEPYGQSMYTIPAPPVVRVQTPNISTYAPPAPPPATFNNPTQTGRYPSLSVAPSFAPSNTAALSMARAAANTSVNAVLPARGPVETAVTSAFVPSLPDELSITTGERIRVIARYDDGWALCANGRGEQGMVPQECLDAPSSVDWQNGRRLSSLNPDGMSY